jgi:hypothetical protein
MTPISEKTLKQMLLLLSGGTMTHRAIAAAVGCSHDAVSRYAARYGFTPLRGKVARWTPEDDAMLLNRASGELWRETAARLGRSRKACQERLSRLTLDSAKAQQRTTKTTLPPTTYRIVTGDMGATDALGRAIEALVAKEAARNRVPPAAVKHFLGWKHAA